MKAINLGMSVKELLITWKWLTIFIVIKAIRKTKMPNRWAVYWMGKGIPFETPRWKRRFFVYIAHPLHRAQLGYWLSLWELYSYRKMTRIL